jgi:hypothetical protein
MVRMMLRELCSGRAGHAARSINDLRLRLFAPATLLVGLTVRSQQPKPKKKPAREPFPGPAAILDARAHHPFVEPLDVKAFAAY